LGKRVYLKYNGIRIINFTTCKNLIVRNTIFPHTNILNVHGPLLMGRFTVGVIAFGLQEMAFKYA
jgi:hypothetical protein